MKHTAETRKFPAPDAWAALMCIFFFFILVVLIVLKYVHLRYDDWDLAFFTQSLWNLCRGSQYSSLTGINFFGDHSYLIVFFYPAGFLSLPASFNFGNFKNFFVQRRGFLPL